MKTVYKMSIIVTVIIIAAVSISFNIDNNKYTASEKNALFENNQLFAEAKCGGCCAKEGKMTSKQSNSGEMKCSSGKCGGSMKEEKTGSNKEENSKNATTNTKSENEVKKEKTKENEKQVPEKVKSEENQMKCAPGKCG